MNARWLMVVAALLVSTSFTVAKAIAPSLDPVTLVLVRFSIAVLLFAPYIQRRFSIAIPTFLELARYSLISASLVFFFWMMFYALNFTSALNTAVIYTLVPGISGIYSRILFREQLGIYRILALVLALIGALWVIFEGDLTLFLALEFNKGDVLFFLGCLATGIYPPLVKLLHRNEPMEIMTFWILVTGTIWLLLLGGNKLFTIEWAQVPLLTWVGITYLAVFCTITTFFLTQFCTLILGPTRVSAYSYLYPPFVLLLDWILGHGLPNPATIPGIILTFAAMMVVLQGNTEKPTSS